MVTGPSGVPTVLIKQFRDFESRVVFDSGFDAPFDCLIAHTAIHPQTANSAPSNATWVDVSFSPHAYYAALLWQWAKGETFMVLEHDVVCRPDVIASFDECPEPWCLYPYAPECPCGNPQCREAWANALGCTRYRKELIEDVPDALTAIPRDMPDGLPCWEWHNVCDGLGAQLRAAGYTHHWHEPAVEHHRLVQRDGLEEYG